MFPLLLLGVALFVLTKLPSGSAPPAALAPTVAKGSGPVPAWPLQQFAALQQGRHYFFTLPVIGAANTSALSAALTLLGFTDVQVFDTGASLAKAPAPHPPGWESANHVSPVACGRWQGAAGDFPVVSSLVPLGFDVTSKLSVYLSTEDWLALHTQA
ncbi:MAG: hypothetical protein M3O46_19890 [Myxococcota bacterium]|nr:hypothetical protein [Myxococcota bacterium]